MYQVLARAWRPQQFDDVVGQKHVTETLKNAIKSDRAAHAYLFVGPRGVGKTSVARIFAKALNCAEGPTITPCDKCDSCTEIMDGRNLDVLEIDGASNNTVDQMRELRDTVKYIPVRSRYKIYIIDEVHMLSSQAFNALLKTLEEPPAHVKFIFATTELQKVLTTIVSRCQRFDLRRIPASLIVGRLEQIVKAEKIRVEPEALAAIARGAEGGLRDAESALDQLISYKGKDIAEADVLSVFGLVSRKALRDAVESILSGDMKQLMRLAAKLDDEGRDMQRFVLDLLSCFRDLLVCLCAGGDLTELDIATAEADLLRKQAAASSSDRLLRITEFLFEADRRMRYALSKRTILEATLIRCARVSSGVSIDEVIAEVNRLKQALSGAGGPDSGAGVMRESRGILETRGARTGADPDGSEGDTELVKRKWREIAEKAGAAAPLVKSALADASPISVSEKEVVIGCDPGFSEHVKRLKMERNLREVKKAIGAVLKRDVEIRLEMLPGGAATKPADPAPPPGGDAAADSSKETGRGGTDEKKRFSGKSVQELMKNDAIRKAVEVFGGEIVDVRE